MPSGRSRDTFRIEVERSRGGDGQRVEVEKRRGSPTVYRSGSEGMVTLSDTILED
jgi:hypothetical protein